MGFRMLLHLFSINCHCIYFVPCAHACYVGGNKISPNFWKYIKQYISILNDSVNFSEKKNYDVWAWFVKGICVYVCAHAMEDGEHSTCTLF